MNIKINFIAIFIVVLGFFAVYPISKIEALSASKSENFSYDTALEIPRDLIIKEEGYFLNSQIDSSKNFELLYNNEVVSNTPMAIPENLIHRYDEGLSPNVPREIPKENIFYKPGFAPLDDNIPREVPRELIHDITDTEREEVKKAIEESIQYTKSKKATNTANTKKITPMQKVDLQEVQKQETTSQKPSWFQRLFKLFSK